MSVSVELQGPPSAAQVFNSYIAAHAVFSLHELGVLEPLHSTGTFDLSERAEAEGLDAVKLRSLAQTLARLGYLVIDGTAVQLTEAGKELTDAHGYFTWLVGGYADVLRELPSLARGQKRYGREVRRDDRHVAAAGPEIDVVARIQEAVEDLLSTIEFDSIVDLGCGNMARLVAVAQRFRGIRGYGIDISPQACELATKLIARNALDDRLSVVEADVLDFLDNGQPREQVDVVFSFAMLHDLFARREPSDLMRSIRRAFPSARWCLLGDTTRHDPSDLQAPPIFSLGFELLHAFMGVPLGTHASYTDAFSAAGFVVQAQRPLGVPATSLFLLRMV